MIPNGYGYVRGRGIDMSIDGFLIAKDRNTSLYQDEEGYYFVKRVDKTEAEEWIEKHFVTIKLDIEDDDIQQLEDMAKDCNMSLDSYITVLLEDAIYNLGNKSS